MNYQTIFDEDPEDGFALRGDVYMWNMMRAATRNNLLSGPEQKDKLQEELETMVRRVYKTATGQDLVGTGEDRVPLFEKVGYGMSKGVCCREWWIETGLPLLKRRLERLLSSPENERKIKCEKEIQKMTINLNYFEDLKKEIEAAGPDKLIFLKNQIMERLRQAGFITQNPEDPTCGWLLFLDAMCDARLGACFWGGGKPLVCEGEDLDFLADWYEKLTAVVRSINQRQKDGRGGCNQQKLEVLIKFHTSSCQRFEKLVTAHNKYATYLNDRTREVLHMCNSGKWKHIDKVDALRSQYL